MVYPIKKNDPLQANAEFFMMASDGSGKTGLGTGSFTETVYKPDGSVGDDPSAVYYEKVDGYYAVGIAANYFNVVGMWHIHPSHPNGDFEATSILVFVTEHDPKDLSDMALDSTVAKDATVAKASAITTLQTDVTFLKDVAGGRWIIENNQMKFYKADNVTLIATFDLKNAAGVAAMKDVFERERI